MTDSQKIDPPKKKANPAKTNGVVNTRIMVGMSRSGWKLSTPTLFMPCFSRSSPVTDRLIAITSRIKGFATDTLSQLLLYNKFNATPILRQGLSINMIELSPDLLC